MKILSQVFFLYILYRNLLTIKVYYDFPSRYTATTTCKSISSTHETIFVDIGKP
jgi:hypothetical protein